jgi:branched-chain amino acid transport system ATP-binding protein
MTAGPAAGPGSAAGPALRLYGLVRTFGGLAAVDGITLALEADERLAVIGPNGAGKTTLFRLICGELRPDSGRVELLGCDVTRMSVHRRARLGLARTFQVSNLFGRLSVGENMRLAAQASSSGRWRFWRPIEPDDRHGRRAREVLDEVGLGERFDDRVADLSHGEQRQLEIAMALATRPRLLLLDEPAAGLAAAERARVRTLLAELPRSLPMVIIEHDMGLAMSLADRVLCMHKGRAIAMGSPDVVRRDPEVQAVYLGRPSHA